MSLTVFTQRNFIAEVLQSKCDFKPYAAVLRFGAPLGQLGTTYDVHLGLIGQRVVDFLLVLTDLFSLGVTAEALGAIIFSKSTISLKRGPVDPTFQLEGVAPINHSTPKTPNLQIFRGLCFYKLHMFWYLFAKLPGQRL